MIPLNLRPFVRRVAPVGSYSEPWVVELHRDTGAWFGNLTWSATWQEAFDAAWEYANA